MRKSLKGKVIVITGASSGFGRGAAIGFAKHGARLVLGARREQALADTVGDCVAAGGEAVAVPTDVGSADDIAALAAEAMQRYQRFDVWVNNAGGTRRSPFLESTSEDLDWVINLNLRGPYFMARECGKVMQANGGGKIINIASLMSVLGRATIQPYNATKYAINGAGCVSACG